MEVLNEWIRLTMGLENILEITFGRGLDLTKLPTEIRNHLEVFCFGMDYLTEKDLEYIDAQWDSLDDLRYIHRLYKTMYLESKDKIKLIISLWQEIKYPIHIAVNESGKIYIRYMMIPLEKIKDNVFIETLNRNFNSIGVEIKNIPITLGIKQYYTPNKEVLYIIDDSNLSGYKSKTETKGMYVGDCLIFEDKIIIIVGDKIIYWDNLNGTTSFMKKDVQIVSELLCMENISQGKMIKHNAFLRNLK